MSSFNDFLVAIDYFELFLKVFEIKNAQFTFFNFLDLFVLLPILLLFAFEGCLLSLVDMDALFTNDLEIIFF